jgi:hypothetical protein
MNITQKFRVFLLLSIVCLAVTFVSREAFSFVNYAFEALTVAITGVLLVTGVYLQGYEEALKDVETRKKETKSH